MILPNFPKNYMKFKKFGPRGGASLSRLLDPPLQNCKKMKEFRPYLVAPPGSANDNYESLFLEIINLFLLPATKLGQGYIFTGVCDSVRAGGGRAWLPGA